MVYARGQGTRPRPMFIATIGAEPVLDHPFSAFLEEAGFARAGSGLHLPRKDMAPGTPEVDDDA